MIVLVDSQLRLFSIGAGEVTQSSIHGFFRSLSQSQSRNAANPAQHSHNRSSGAMSVLQALLL